MFCGDPTRAPTPDTGMVALRAVRLHPAPRQASGGVMLKFQWNALRRHDTVFVHDPSDTDLGLRAGIVTLIDVGHRGRAARPGILCQRKRPGTS